MKNNALLNQEVAFGADQLLKVTALLYLKEALATQEYETCPDLIDTAKKLGVDPGEISAMIKDHLEVAPQVRIKGNRLPA
jgi:hypothetical protein